MKQLNEVSVRKFLSWASLFIWIEWNIISFAKPFMKNGGTYWWSLDLLVSVFSMYYFSYTQLRMRREARDERNADFRLILDAHIEGRYPVFGGHAMKVCTVPWLTDKFVVLYSGRIDMTIMNMQYPQEVFCIVQHEVTFTGEKVTAREMKELMEKSGDHSISDNNTNNMRRKFNLGE